MVKRNFPLSQKPALTALTRSFFSNRRLYLYPHFPLKRGFRPLLPLSLFIFLFCLLIPLSLSFSLPRAFCAPFGTNAPVPEQSFRDLENHWAKSTVYRLAALDLFAGYPDGSFRPDQPVTQLEAVALVMRAGGFAEAGRPGRGAFQSDRNIRTGGNTVGALGERTGAARQINQQGQAAPADRATGGGPGSSGGPGGRLIPAVPWGEEYLHLAVEKEFLPPPLLASFAPNTAITRAETAALLSRALQLPLPLPHQPAEEAGGSGPGNTLWPEDAPAAAKPAPAGPQPETAGTPAGADRLPFTDLLQAPPFYAPYIQAAARAGVMSGYPDGSFRPNQGLSRAEMAVLLARLLDRRWVKVPPGRQLTGWISGITQTRGGSREIEFTTLEGTRKIRPAPGLKCFSGDQETQLFQTVNHRVELILNRQKQARYVNIFERRSTLPPSERLTGTVKSVLLGEDNLLRIVDLDCVDRILPLAWFAAVEGKNAGRGFLSLRPGTFVEIALSDEKVTKVTTLDVKKISGTVESLTGKTLRLARSGEKMKWPEWFHYWDRARIVDREGKKTGGLSAGDRVQITYLDPLPDEIEDERVLEITVQSAAPAR